MRTVSGRFKSCLYIRTTSAAALLTKRSTWSRVRIISRHSVKKCPEPVRAQPQRGVASQQPWPLPRSILAHTHLLHSRREVVDEPHRLEPRSHNLGQRRLDLVLQQAAGRRGAEAGAGKMLAGGRAKARVSARFRGCCWPASLPPIRWHELHITAGSTAGSTVAGSKAAGSTASSPPCSTPRARPPACRAAWTRGLR